MTKKIVLTGGGTAGHVTPNLALLPQLRKLGYDIEYIGSYNGMEKSLVEKAGIPYHGIDSGKLRRYHDLKNFTDPMHVGHGFLEARKILKKLKPDIIFSKGGFVSVPVVYAAAGQKIPVIIHESDMTPGLANKLCFPVATRVCCNFPETMKLLPAGKRELTGCPIREELSQGDAERGKALSGLTGGKPVILVIGGSLGAEAVNRAVRSCLPKLLQDFQVLHICGREKVDETMQDVDGYRQYAYVTDDLKHFFAMADVVISRAGANAICEILDLHKPNILIPLGTAGSRGDQLLNARSFEAQGFSKVLSEETLTDDLLYAAVKETYENREDLSYRMEASQLDDGIENVIHLIEELTGKEKP